jgi:hypothetical protein
VGERRAGEGDQRVPDRESDRGAEEGRKNQVNELKQYLGDSVYADFDGYSIKLTTENGDGPSNTIWLEPEVMLALEAYRKRFFRGAHEQPIAALK